MNNTTSFLFTLLFIALLGTTAHAQGQLPVTDYLSIPGPLLFEKKIFNLSWSSHPSKEFYKQEYLMKGDPANQYKTMLMFDVITGSADIKAMVATKLAELKQLKINNPLVTYETCEPPNPGEYMIDFVLTANGPDGKTVSIAERNVYRYKPLPGQKGVLLFGVSSRAYGASAKDFLAALQKNNKPLISSVAQFNLPTVTVKR